MEKIVFHFISYHALLKSPVPWGAVRGHAPQITAYAPPTDKCPPKLGLCPQKK